MVNLGNLPEERTQPQEPLTVWFLGFLPALSSSSSHKPCSCLQRVICSQWCQCLSVTPLLTPPPLPNRQPGSEAPRPPKCRTSSIPFVLPSCSRRRLVSCRFSLPPSEEPRPLPLAFLSCPHLCCTSKLLRPCTDRPRGSLLFLDTSAKLDCHGLERTKAPNSSCCQLCQESWVTALVMRLSVTYFLLIINQKVAAFIRVHTLYFIQAAWLQVCMVWPLWGGLIVCSLSLSRPVSSLRLTSICPQSIKELTEDLSNEWKEFCKTEEAKGGNIKIKYIDFKSQFLIFKLFNSFIHVYGEFQSFSPPLSSLRTHLPHCIPLSS